MDTIYHMDRLPTGAGKFLPTSARENVSGMAANAATAIARLGGEVALWAAAGDDPVGDRLVAVLDGEGIDCGFVQRVNGAPSAMATVVVDRDGERMIIPFYAPELFAAPALPAAIAGGDFAVVMSDMRWATAAEMAMGAARAASIPRVFDADVAPPDVLARLAPLASHVVASAPGAALLTGSDEPQVAVGRIAERYDGEAVVTAGERGSYWFDREAGAVRHMPAPAVQAVDTTAAGDVFHGGFALALAEGRDMRAALRFATAAAALKCTRYGGRLGAPGRAETDALAATLGG
jgi:sulfofructose kinase